MLRVCPRCRGTSRHFLCPHCGIRTDDAEGSGAFGKALPTVRPPDGPSLGGGLLIGLLLAQGLYYALHHLGSAVLLAGGDAAAEAAYWGSFDGLIVQQAMQAVTLLLGGMIAAAGQRHGLAVGAGVGGLNALLAIGLRLAAREPTDELFLYGQPVLHAFVGAIGGVIGSRLWQPAPQLPPLAAENRYGNEMLTTVLPDRPSDVTVEPLPWGRMLIGIGVAVGGTLGARMIRDLVVVASGGTGHEMQQSQFITWEITLVAQLIGGAIAGANTRGGVSCGFWVGLPSAGLLLLANSLTDIPTQAHVVPAWLLGLPVPEGSTAAFVIQAVQALALCVLGGWLGGLILPSALARRAYDAR
jgi:hypothetical protein